MTPVKHYSKAPITEAVIDLRFEDRLAGREMERLRDRLKRQYPTIEETRNFKIEFGPKLALRQETALAGFKLTGPSGADIVLINEVSFGTARLAPYDRWEMLLAEAKKNFETFTGVVGRKKIVRIGVRFINRFDIPNELISEQPISKFLRVAIAIPTEMTRIIGPFSFSLQGVEPQTETPYILNCVLLAQPALIAHVSVQLDIDVYWDNQIPSRIDEVWAGTERLRSAKNGLFEQSITDELRKLFE